MGFASLNPSYGAASAEIQLLEEIIPLVIDDDEGGEILHLDAPDRLHAELGIFHRLDLLDAMLGEVRRRAADRGEIEAAVLPARLAHRARAVALRSEERRVGKECRSRWASLQQ